MNGLDAVILGAATAAHDVARAKNREIERLTERLGAVTMLLGSAKSALKDGRVIDAAEWISAAERAARGGEK